ncbi:hypothetical protein B0H10DRAFT_836527 [Mycena sp. CBHHK59/15]|nr:hypothetical protein B0H10DRAFT_836527 [Mycena sp. CBHHK59/15]
MGESRAWTVATGTIVTSVGSTCVTGLYATFKGTRHEHLALASAFNSAVSAATFFTIREYVVSPTISATVDYSRQRGEAVAENKATPEHLSWSRLRTHNLIDSGLSGAITGGILRGIVSGRRMTAPAAVTTGVACVILQAVYNELGIQRIKYVGKTLSQNSPNTLLPSPQDTLSPDAQTAWPAPDVTLQEEANAEPAAKPLVTARILGIFGVKMLSDDEILVKLKRQRDEHLVKIKELEKELEDDRKRDV